VTSLFRIRNRIASLFLHAWMSLLIRLSSKIHEKITYSYWSKPGVETGSFFHKEESVGSWRQILALVPTDSGKSMVDYGGGYGELAEFFKTQGYTVWVSDFYDSFQEYSRRNGMRYIDARILPREKFDVIVANNCLFYVHPTNLHNEITRLIDSLKQGGVLLITDTPTMAGMKRLNWPLMQKIVGGLTQVHDPRAGAFFVNGSALVRKFGAKQIASWSSYREHFVIRA